VTTQTERRARPEPKPFDPRRPHRLSAEHRRALALVFEAFAHRVSTLLATRLRTNARVSMHLPEQMTYAEFMHSTDDPACLGVMGLLPLPGTGVLRIDVPLALCAVDRLLGGTGGGEQPDRGLSEIETKLLRSILEPAVAELGGAFTPVVSFDPQLVRLESKPQLVRGASPESVMVTVDFEVVIGDDQFGLTVCMPLSSIAPALEQFTVSGPGVGAGVEAASAAAVTSRLMETAIDVSVRFGTVALTSAEILDLQIGDVVPLRHPVQAPLTLFASGVPCFSTAPGRRGKRLACRIVDPADDNPSEPEDDASSASRQENLRW
jgi:flagellar motor switch protein FliM